MAPSTFVSGKLWLPSPRASFRSYNDRGAPLGTMRSCKIINLRSYSIYLGSPCGLCMQLITVIKSNLTLSLCFVIACTVRSGTICSSSSRSSEAAGLQRDGNERPLNVLLHQINSHAIPFEVCVCVCVCVCVYACVCVC